MIYLKLARKSHEPSREGMSQFKPDFPSKQLFPKPKEVQKICTYVLDAVGSSGILKGKQKLGVTFNSDKLGGIDFTKFSKLTMCSA